MTGITQAEYHAKRAAEMTERQLQDLILDAARKLGWLVYHTHDSRRSQPGFPDLVLVKGKRILYRELKRQTGRTTPDQDTWLAALTTAGQDARIWRPTDWFANLVTDELTRAVPVTVDLKAIAASLGFRLQPWQEAYGNAFLAGHPIPESFPPRKVTAELERLTRAAANLQRMPARP